jgi:hypothetical protein
LREATFAALTLLLVAPVRAAEVSTCTAHLEDTYRSLEARPAATVFLPVMPGFEPPLGTRGRPVSNRNTVFVQRGVVETRIDGEPTRARRDRARAAAVAVHIDGLRKNWALLHAGDPVPPRWPVALVADRRLPAREALSLAQALGDGYDLVVVTVEETPGRRRNFPAAVTARLERIEAAGDAQHRIAERAQAFKEALAPCPDHERFFADLKVDDPAGEHRLHQATVAAVKACSCHADVELIEALALAGAEQPPAAYAQPLQLVANAGVTLTLARDASVQDLVQRLPPASFAVRWKR